MLQGTKANAADLQDLLSAILETASQGNARLIAEQDQALVVANGGLDAHLVGMDTLARESQVQISQLQDAVVSLFCRVQSDH